MTTSYFRSVPLRRLVASLDNGAWGDEPGGEDDNDVLCIRAADFDFNQLRVIADRAPMRSLPAAARRRLGLVRGDIVLEKSGGGEHLPVGRAVLFDLPQRAVCSNFAARLRVVSSVEPRFLTYVLASHFWAGATARSIKQTTGIQNLDTDEWLQTPTPCPDVAVQRRITDFLDDQVSRIDQAVSLRQEQLRLVSIRHRTSLVEAAIAMGATAPGVPWFPMSADWLVRPLKAVSRCGDARRIPLSAVERSTRKGEYRYFGASKVVDFVDDYLFEGEYVLVGEDGASLENFDFDVVQRVSGRFWVNNHAHVLSAEKGVTNDYLAHYLRAADRSFLISGATRPKITQEDLMNLPVVVPSPSEQAAMVSVADGMRQAGNTLAESLTRSVDLLQERKRALITAAVTEQFDVSTASGRGVA